MLQGDVAVQESVKGDLAAAQKVRSECYDGGRSSTTHCKVNATRGNVAAACIASTTYCKVNATRRDVAAAACIARRRLSSSPSLGAAASHVSVSRRWVRGAQLM